MLRFLKMASLQSVRRGVSSLSTLSGRSFHTTTPLLGDGPGKALNHTSAREQVNPLSAFCESMSSGNVTQVEKLLDFPKVQQYLELTGGGPLALARASRAGQYSLVDFLLEKKDTFHITLDPASTYAWQYVEAVEDAALNGDVQMVKRFLPYEALITEVLVQNKHNQSDMAETIEKMIGNAKALIESERHHEAFVKHCSRSFIPEFSRQSLPTISQGACAVQSQPEVDASQRVVFKPK